MVKKEDTAPATKSDLQATNSDFKAYVKAELTKYATKEEMNAGFEVMNRQFKTVLDLMHNQFEEARRERREIVEHLEQLVYNKTTEQDVIIRRNTGRIERVEKHVGLVS